MSLQVNSVSQPPKSPKLFRSQKEMPKPEQSKIKGNVPTFVRGVYMRVGPGKFDFDKDFSVEHFFDGYAIVSKFTIEDGTVALEKKFLESDAYKKAVIAQKPVVAEFATKSSPDPTKGFFSKMIPSVIPELSDNGNLSLFAMGTDVFATSETCYFRDIDPKTLSSVDKFDTNKYFGLNSASAHPLTDDDGYTYNVGASILTGVKYNIVKIPPIGKNQVPKDAFKKAKIICSINSSNGSLLSFTHSFGMTKHYIIIIEQPFVMNIAKVLASVLQKGQTPCNWLEWHSELKNKFIIIEKETGKVLKTEVIAEVPFFFLHIINCFELNDHIVIDLTTFPNANVVGKDMKLTKLRRMSIHDSDNSRGDRYVIPLLELDENVKEGINQVSLKCGAKAVRVGKQLIVTPEIITEKGLELPVINKKFLAKKTSFYWATGSAQKGFFENALGKVHASKKETILWRESEHYFLGEPMFVQNPNATTEDDGVLIAAVIDNRDDHNDFLLFLDAKTMKELGRAEFKDAIPQAIHGLWIPAEDKTKK